MITGCPICGAYEVEPGHSHYLGTVLNSRYYCPDGREHVWTRIGHWLLRREVCVRCDQPKPRGSR